METVNIEEIDSIESIIDPYMVCKFLERKGIPIDKVTLGNVHDAIKEAVDENQLPISQVVIENNYLINNEPVQDTIEGYLIRRM